MLNELEISILLITGYSPRKNAMFDLLEEVCGKDSSINITSNTNELNKFDEFSPELCLLDLPNIKEPSLEVIKKVKDHFEKSKIVAIHFYSSSILVDPLYSAGIDGYLTYEPTRTSIKKAFECVFSDKTYIPKEILSS